MMVVLLRRGLLRFPFIVDRIVMLVVRGRTTFVVTMAVFVGMMPRISIVSAFVSMRVALEMARGKSTGR